MNKVVANVCLLVGGIGFLYFLFIIVAGFFGCCAGLTTPIFYKIILIVLGISVAGIIFCVYNNCYRNRKSQ